MSAADSGPTTFLVVLPYNTRRPMPVRPGEFVIEELKVQNREWVKEVDCQDPTFFKRTAEKQEPTVSIFSQRPYTASLQALTDFMEV